MKAIEHGALVLATKYSDGSPLDPWAIGFYDGFRDGRYFVVDNNGIQFRAGGFRRVDLINEDKASLIIKHSSAVTMSRKSLWAWRRCSVAFMLECFEG